MADWSNLGQALVGGGGELAYEKGRGMAAQTEAALAQASERVDKARAQERLAFELYQTGLPKSVADASATTLAAGGNLGDVLTALGHKQEQDFRATAGNPGTSNAAANAALRGVANGPVDQFQHIGNSYVDRFAEGATPTALPKNGGEGSHYGPLELAAALGMVDPEGNFKPEFREAGYAMGVPSSSRVVDAGGVPTEFSRNPFRPESPLGPALAPPGAAPAPGAPPVAAPRPAVPRPAVTALVPTATVASNTAEIAGGKELAQIRAKKFAELPGVQQNTEKMKTDIDALLSSPGFDSIYGKLAGPAAGITQNFSQDIANANANRDQIKAQIFQTVVPYMKGLGSLSNAEGLKLESAYTAATAPRIDAATARIKWEAVKRQLDRSMIVAEIEAGQGARGAAPAPAAPAAPAAPVLGPGEHLSKSGKVMVNPSGDGVTWVYK